MEVQKKNYLLFSTARTSMIKDGATFTVKGFKLPFFRGRYKILVEEPGYGFTEPPEKLKEMLRTVRSTLKDRKSPKGSVAIRQV